jgi:hypothetical protein
LENRTNGEFRFGWRKIGQQGVEEILEKTLLGPNQEKVSGIFVMAPKKVTLLTDEQRKFLTLFNEEKSLYKKFYLTGGTALSEFYLHHRLSEDLDFFSEEEFSILPISSFIKKSEKVLND